MTDERAQTHADDLPCVEVVEILTDYLEGVLPTAETRRLERHLDSCPGCGEYLEQLRAVDGSLSGLADDSIPVELRDRLISDFLRLRGR